MFDLLVFIDGGELGGVFFVFVLVLEGGMFVGFVVMYDVVVIVLVDVLNV